MESENKANTQQERNTITLSVSIVIASLVLAGAWIYTTGMKSQPVITSKHVPNLSDENRPGQEELVALPVKWRDLGARMIEAGVIDKNQFEAIYAVQGGVPEREQKLLTGLDNGNVIIDQKNASILLNLFWALGLGNKNRILEEGPMMSPRYGGAERFASTGGWTLAHGNAMAHYSAHIFLALTEEDQTLVENVAKNIYRPCCNNATYFPDCNHGMAMLGLLQFLASGGATEGEMYRIALATNAFWFPEQYATIAQYFTSRNIDPQRVNPKEILGEKYSSISGFQTVATQVEVPEGQGGGGGGCGV
ncbi:MAG: hypothetical protein NUV53_01965 [Patescibacteria group bacterium]|nr:hypothetical protein [Patescibacteria group bacterium]